MRLRDMIQNYCLHDSNVEGIHYLPDQEKLIIEAEIYACQEEEYKDSDAFIKKLVFTGVKNVVMNFDTSRDFEIYTARIIGMSQEEREAIEIVLLELDSQQKGTNIEVLNFEAKDVQTQK